MIRINDTSKAFADVIKMSWTWVWPIDMQKPLVSHNICIIVLHPKLTEFKKKTNKQINEKINVVRKKNPMRSHLNTWTLSVKCSLYYKIKMYAPMNQTKCEERNAKKLSHDFDIHNMWL